MPSTAERGACASAGAGTLEAALDVLAADGLVAFPTETVWGLAARAQSPRAIGRLRDWKGRADDKALSLLVDDARRLESLGVALPELARRLVAAFWPGPLTLVVPAAIRLAPGVAAPDGTVGLRCSPDPVATALARGAFERGLGPITATSLNASGEPPARDEAAAARLLAASRGKGKVALFSLGPSSLALRGGALPSTVVRLGSDGGLEVLREGAIPREVLEAAAAETRSR